MERDRKEVTLPAAPTLSRADVQAELCDIHARKHRTRTTALYGTGERGEVDATIQGETVSFRVVPVGSELRLRQALADADGDGAPLALLLPFGGELSPDLRAHVAGGRIYLVTRKRRLAQIFVDAAGGRFGVAPVASGALLAEKALCEALLRDPDRYRGRIDGTTIDVETAWRRLLSCDAGLPENEVLSEAQLAAFCARTAGGTTFRERCAAVDKLLPALGDFIEARAGKLGRIAWQAWERGDGLRFAAWAMVLDAAAPLLCTDGYLQGALEKPLAEVAGCDVVGDGALAGGWGELAGGLAARLTGDELARVVAEAEAAVGGQAKVIDALLESRYLPRAHERAKEVLADALWAAAEAPVSESLAAARVAFSRVRDHTLADEGVVERAEMAVRLVAYLATRAVREPLREAVLAEEAAGLAELYAEEGGFVDLARARAASGDGDALSRAAGGVIAAVNEARDGDDRRFAEALTGWIAAGRPMHRAVGIERALDKFAVEFLRGGCGDRRLAVVLLDGLSWAAMVELLIDMERRRFGPIRWRPKSYDRFPPMLAALPTITEVSRSALFAGKLMAPGKSHATSKDPERFEDHAGLRKVLEVGPRLFLKGEVEAADGFASDELCTLLGSDDRVVGCVINTVDDHLKGPVSLDVRFSMDTIKALKAIFEAATEADRALLLVADHGHAPAHRMAYQSAPSGEGGARWRALAEGEEPADFEMAFAGEGVWAPRKGQRVALVATETARFSSMSHAGEHGGACLSEVVAPAMLVAADSLAQSLRYVGDDEMVTAVLQRPLWWDLELPVRRGASGAGAAAGSSAAAGKAAAASAAAAASPAAARPRRKKPVVPAAQESLPLGPVPTPASAVSPSPETSWVRALLESHELFAGLNKAKRAELSEVIDTIELLCDYGDNGRMPAEQFAHRVGIPRHRLDGVIARMQEYLNREGYNVIALAGDQVELSEDTLRDLFEE